MSDQRGTRIHLLGPGGERGTYVLRIHVQRDLDVAFGACAGGRPLPISAGDWLYVGSALGRGATGLPRRLVRHATRTEDRPPHAVRPVLAAALGGDEASLAPRTGKTRHWHVDYLLDEPDAELRSVIALRWPERLETQVATWLRADERVSAPAAGLGASDAAGAHLMRVTAEPVWWARLPARLAVRAVRGGGR